MKRLLTLPGNYLLVLGAVACTMGSVITAFSFTVDARLLVFTWLAATLLISTFFTIWRGKALLVLLLPVVLAILWKLPEITEGAKWVIFYITTEYNKWLFVPILFSDAKLDANALTLFFAAAGLCLSFLLSIAVCMRRSTFLTILFTLPFVFLAFVLVIHQPDIRFLLGLIAVYLTLLISNSLYPNDFIKRGVAVFPAFALAMVVMGVTFILAPPENYRREGQIDSLDRLIRNIVAQTGLGEIKSGIGWPEVTEDAWRFNTERVSISDAGTRFITDKVILDITANGAGSFYLKGYSMDSFDGRSWLSDKRHSPTNTIGHEETQSSAMPVYVAIVYSNMFPNRAPPIVEMTIRKIGDASENISYMPYYSVPHWQNAKSYSTDFYYIEDSVLYIYEEVSSYFSADNLSIYSQWINSEGRYTQIETSTAEGLRQLAVEAGIDPDADRAVVVDMVAEYISASARYTLSPFVTPEGEDFALYFLRSSRQGYCIHFATAATLMLRALDIPARFTSGFVATVEKEAIGKAIELTDRNAHAWVEVYYDAVGWLPLEVTPPAPDSGVPGGRLHAGGGIASMPQRPIDVGEDHHDPLGDGGQLGQYPTTPTPTAGADGESDPDDALGRGAGIFIAVFAVACILALVLRRLITIKIREKRFAQEDTNAAVICTWRYISRLLRRVQAPEEIEDLALKARFSQHRISGEERSEMVNYAEKLAHEIRRSKNRFGRLWMGYVRGLW